MTETFILLLAAHVLGDFVLQTESMAQAKHRPQILILHTVIHLAVTVLILGAWHPALLLLVLAHLIIDMIKTYCCPPDLRGFLLDQAAHLITLAALALMVPAIWGDSLWSRLLPPALSADLPLFWLHVAGLILAIRAGGFAVALILDPYLKTAPQLTQGSLPGAGALIGKLERSATYLLILLGQPTAVAFLVAAKSVLRFQTARDDRKISEYIIAGTLASIGWAMMIALLVRTVAGKLI